MKKVKFHGVECDVVFNQYQNGRTVIRLTENGMPYATATINDTDTWLEPNQVLIKDYAENEGMVSALVYSGIVEKLEDKYTLMGPYGAKAWVCNLLVNPKWDDKEQPLYIIGNSWSR